MQHAHPLTLFVIAFLAVPSIAMLPAIALENGPSKKVATVEAFVPIPMEHVDTHPRPRPKPRVRPVRRPAAKPRRSTPALRLGFSWPVAKAEITSPFGWRPFVVTPGMTGPHPAREFHHGADIACALNQPVTASKGGRVILAGVNVDYGNVIVIQHAGGWSTLYGHLNKLLVVTGRWVPAHALIGLCGMTGRANGVHLHFEVRHNGTFFDPLKFLP